MQVVTQEFVKNKKVLLRYDIDVALKQGERGKGKGERNFTLHPSPFTLHHNWHPRPVVSRTSHR